MKVNINSAFEDGGVALVCPYKHGDGGNIVGKCTTTCAMCVKDESSPTPTYGLMCCGRVIKLVSEKEAVR